MLVVWSDAKEGKMEKGSGPGQVPLMEWWKCIIARLFLLFTWSTFLELLSHVKVLKNNGLIDVRATNTTSLPTLWERPTALRCCPCDCFVVRCLLFKDC